MVPERDSRRPHGTVGLYPHAPGASSYRPPRTWNRRANSSTALSPRSQLELLKLLVELGRKGVSQFIIATHSPILLACPKAVIFSFDGPRIAPVEYEQTAHYQLYRDFMADPAKYIRGL